MTRRTSVWRRIWPAILLVCLHSFGQASGLRITHGSISPFLQQGQADIGPHTVRGTVVDSVTGEPIYRALVQVGGQFAALTDHEGHFEFEGVTENIQPWAMKPGYFPDPHHFRFVTDSSGSSASSATDQTEGPQMVLKLVPEAVLSGTVTGSDGGPLEGIPVTLKVLSVSDGLMRWRHRGQTRTNSEGQYRFAELEAGKYAVATGFHTEGLAEAQTSVAYVPARYPPAAGNQASSNSSSPTASIALTPGDHREANLNPDVERLYPVTGLVTGYGEGRRVGFRAETVDGEEISPMSRFNARTGEFRVMLPGGTFAVTATAYLNDGPMEGRLAITVPQAPVNGITVGLEPYATIPVEVEADAVNQPDQGQSQQPGAPAQLSYSDLGVSANISLASAGDAGNTSVLNTQPLRRHRGGDDSTAGAPRPLAIENIAPGRYLMQAMPPSPWYVASASCGGVDLMREELSITGGAAGCSIRVVLRNDSGTIHVTLRDAGATLGAIANDSPNGNGTVIYILPEGDLVRQPVIASGWSPAYQGSPVAPGRYLVLALDHREELAYRDPEALRRYAAVGQEVTVSPNGTADVEVAVTTGTL